MDVKSAFLYGTIEEEVYVNQPPGFVDPKFLDIVYKVEKALYGLHQAPRAWYETLSSYILDNGFTRRIIDKTIFIKKIKNDILLVQVVKSASTPMETHKPLSKDLDGIDDSPLELISYSDSDYASASLNRNSTTGGCQFLGIELKGYFLNDGYADLCNMLVTKLILLFWNTASSKTVNFMKKIHAIVDGKAVVISKSFVRSDLIFDDEDGITYLANDEIFENLVLMGYDLSTKLTFQKGSSSP
uniref:Reverse transcriptase n=1 Tax=Tanacetum cinerariifolium TaxID=118510 RepID=A0A6L2KMC0_TANCI|nr:reverse transcriptase [Tanacetum cinerariifolium]